nr:hypothetical protein [Planctomycetota bacterium]
MSLLARLRDLGSRLGILQLAQPKSERAPAKVTMRTVSLAELQSEVM